MKIEKANFGVDGEKVSLSVPLAKVDAENRIVSGFATLDNVDTQSDVVTAEASVLAFERSRRNLREMHQKKAVGRVVSFKEDEFYDAETQKFYKGIYVDAYVSKGAQDTWEKVLDGTLAAFSIGGAIVDSETSIVKDATGGSKPVRIIKDYNLTELSLVDSGANQLANVFSITKMADGDLTADGMAAEVVIENVFFCETDNIAKSVQAEAATCSNCSQVMKNIGWIEPDSDREAAVSELVAKVITTRDITTIERSEEMSENTTSHGDHDNVTVNSATAEDVLQNAEGVEPDKEVVEESKEEENAADVKEDVPVDEEPNVQKMIGDLSDQIKTSFEKSSAETGKLIGEVDAKLEKSNGELKAEIEALTTKHNELVEKFNGLEGNSNDVAKRLDVVEAGTAIKKSNDLGGSSEDSTIIKRKESIWEGAFLGTSAL